MTSPPTQPLDQPEDAAAWFARLQEDDCVEADWQAFTAWLEADPSRGAAYEQVEAAWVDLDAAEPEIPWAAIPSKVVPLQFRRVFGWRRAAVIGAITSIAAALALTIGLGTISSPTTEYVTPLGQPREVALADGSKLALNGGTRLSVKLGRRERSVRLAEGEATFDVTHDPDRPFRIAAGDKRIEVVGTEFDVINHSGDLTVTVRRGVVAVAPHAAASPILLPAGKQLRQPAGPGAPTVQDVDPAQAFAWRSGRLIYRDARLTEVAEDLSRYAGKPVRVDPATKDFRVTGAVAIEGEMAMARRLETFLPIEVKVSRDEIRIGPAAASRAR